MNSAASSYHSLKYQKSTTSGSIDIGIRKFEFVAKTQFLSPENVTKILLLTSLLLRIKLGNEINSYHRKEVILWGVIGFCNL